MSKKSRRQAARQFTSAAARTTEFKPDYSFIKQDLKRIGILAGTFFAILVVLAIFQNQLIGLFLK
jgi:hypothetical protein